MNINTEKVTSVFTTFKSVWIAFGLILTTLAVASDYRNDTRYLQIADSGKMEIRIQLNALQNRVEELIIQKKFTKSTEQKEMIQALIDIKKSKIDALRNNPN